jgi:hypothetical protein
MQAHVVFDHRGQTADAWPRAGDIGDDHVGAGSCKFNRRSAANASWPASAGDQRDLSAEWQIKHVHPHP